MHDRVVAGVGVPQITAVMECGQGLPKGRVPLISDGGIRYSGTSPRPWPAGAQTVMLGSLLAGVEESPVKWSCSKDGATKCTGAWVSLGAMAEGSADRYFQEGTESWQTRSRGNRRPCSVQGETFRGCLSTGRRCEIRHGILRSQNIGPIAGQDPICEDHGGGRQGEPSPRRSDHQGSAELPQDVKKMKPRHSNFTGFRGVTGSRERTRFQKINRKSECDQAFFFKQTAETRFSDWLLCFCE